MQKYHQYIIICWTRKYAYIL